jgi:hypothetical protein
MVRRRALARIGVDRGADSAAGHARGLLTVGLTATLVAAGIVATGTLAAAGTRGPAPSSARGTGPSAVSRDGGAAVVWTIT